MQKKISFCLLFFCLHLLSQNDSTQIFKHKENIYVGYDSPNIDNSVYTALQNIWFANEKISYLAIPSINNQENINIPLRDGEGKHGFLFEGSLLHQAPIMMGRNHSNHFKQTSRITFDYGFNIRMTKDNSSPLIPNNNIIGINIDKVLWDSETKLSTFSGKKDYAFNDWNSKENSLESISLNLTAHHYSNGQPPGFFVKDSTNSRVIYRNDYLRGDFSTNLFQIGVTYSKLTSKRNLYSAKIAYQNDGDWFGPLSFSTEQLKSYGNHRITGFFQFLKLFRTLKKNPVDAYNKQEAKIEKVRIFKNRELIFRYEYEYIIGDLSNYIHEKKYRYNSSLYIKYTQTNWRALGFVGRVYYGRDYSNIRYDLPIFSIMFGLSIDFNKFFIPLSKKMRLYNIIE